MTQLQYEELDLCRLILKIGVGFASSWLFSSANFQFRTETFLSILLCWLELPARFWVVEAFGNVVKSPYISPECERPNKNTRENPSKTIVMPTYEQNDQEKCLVEGILKITGPANRWILASARLDERRKFLFSQSEMTVLPVVTGILYRLLVPGP